MGRAVFSLQRNEPGDRTERELKIAKVLWVMKAAQYRCEEYSQRRHFEKDKDTFGDMGRTPQRPNHSLGKSINVLGESLTGMVEASRGKSCGLQRPAVV